MPQAIAGAIGFVFSLSSATVATISTVVTSVFTGAAIGAAVGAASAIITGEDILDAALKGAAIGGVTGGIGKGLSLASTATNVADAGVELGSIGDVTTATDAAVETAESFAENLPSAFSETAKTGINAATKTGINSFGSSLPNIAGNVGGEAAKSGLLSSIMGKINTPETWSGLLSGGAKAMLESQENDNYIDALMERDRLNREAGQIGGLTDLNLNSTMPTVKNMKPLPIWTFDESGRLQKTNPQLA